MQIRAQWQQIEVIPGKPNGWCSGMIVIGSSIYIEAENSVYLSTNNGDNWTKTGTLPAQLRILTGDSTHFYAGTSDEVFRSTDRGVTWTGMTFPGTHSSIGAIAAQGSSVVVATGDAIFYWSTDYGDTWLRDSSDVQSPVVSSMAFGGNTVYAGTFGGLYRSPEKEQIWRRETNWPIEYDLLRIWHILAVGDTIYVGTNGGQIISYDNGATWSTKHTLFAQTALAVKGNTMIAPSDFDVYFSADKGETWKKVGGKIVGNYKLSTIFFGDYIFLSTSTGLYRSTPADLAAVGVEEDIPAADMLISPNPAAESFTVRCPDAASITVRDVFGKELGYYPEITNGGATISTGDYASGVYFVEVVGRDNSRVVRKVVVSR